MKTILLIALGISMTESLLQAQLYTPVDEAFLRELRVEAARNHPAAHSARLRAIAAQQDTRSIRLWEDPSIGLTLMPARARMRADDGDIRVSYEQALPKRGMFQANLAKAAALNRAELENSKLAALAVAGEAAKDVIELALLDESIALQTEQLKWLNAMTENARQMAQNPNGSGVDALRLESELAREKQILSAAATTRQRVAQTLNLRLGRSTERAWPPLRLADTVAIPIASGEIARIPRRNPKFRAMQEMAASARAETRITASERQPQLTASVDANLYSGGDIRSLGLGLRMSLPAFNQKAYTAKTLAAADREKAAASDIEAIRLELVSGILTATTAAKNAAAQAHAYQGEIYQRSLAATQAVESSWISSKASLSDLLDARRQLFSIRLEQRRFVAMQWLALEELNSLVPHSNE